MKDNVGNEVFIGDYVFCFSGSLKNTVQKVASFRTIKEVYGVREAFNFDSGGWLSAHNTVSLNALGAKEFKTASKSGCDALGNPLHEGDKVLYLHPMEYYLDIGVVKKLATKSCLLAIKKNRFGQEEYRKKYEEILSLTAMGKEDLAIVYEEWWRARSTESNRTE